MSFKSVEEYLDYWAKRAAKQAEMMVGHCSFNPQQLEEQTELYWSVLSKPLLEWLPIAEDDRIARKLDAIQLLDLGCGWGRFWSRMLSLSPVLMVDGVDITLDMAELAKNTIYDLRSSRLSVTIGLPGVLHCVTDSQDIVWSVTCLQHITIPKILESTLREIRRVLHPGGLLLALENTHVGKVKNGVQPLDYIHFREPDFYLDAFKSVGFDCNIIKHVDCVGERHTGFLGVLGK